VNIQNICLIYILDNIYIYIYIYQILYIYIIYIVFIALNKKGQNTVYSIILKKTFLLLIFLFISHPISVEKNGRMYFKMLLTLSKLLEFLK
jgi:hypothetical protein